MSTQTPNTADTAIPQVLQVLSLRYSLMPKDGLRLAEAWLQQNPSESSASLRAFLMSNQILVKNGGLLDLRQISQAQIEHLVAILRGKSGIAIRDRWHRARKYPQCFLGNEAVRCIQTVYGSSIAEAVRLGQLLIENQVIHHVVDEHGFENDALFYRFYQDESDRRK